MPSGIAQRMVDLNRTSLVSSLSQNLEGEESSLAFYPFFEDGTPGSRGLQWKKVEDRGRIWPTYDAQEGVLFSVLVLSHLFPHLDIINLWSFCFSEDTLSRWCATEVDSEGVMLPVSFLSFSIRTYLIFTYLHLFERVNGDGAKPPATMSNCWTVTSIAGTTAIASTTTMTPGDWLASVTVDIRPTEYSLVWRICQKYSLFFIYLVF